MSDRCLQCGHDVSESQRFCGRCGAALSGTCPACGAHNPAEFRFCGNCGTDLSAAPASSPVEERRWATVLFADLSGFTSLSERTDPEEVKGLVDSFSRLLGEVVVDYGGVVDNVIGDAVLAVFGAPVAHEDDAERAVRAALEMQRRSAAEAEAFRELPLRIGVNTGEVMFAPVGPESHRDHTVVGDVVNTASRLQTAASQGQILVGEQTWRASRRAIRFEEIDPIVVKGKSEPVYAWLAVEAVAAPADRPVSAAPMVGRGLELDVLRTTWEHVVSDSRPRLVALLGPAGIGKTRLGREFRSWLEAGGVRVLVGRCLPYGGRSGYGAFASIVKDAAGVYETDPVDEARDKLRCLAGDLLPQGEAEQVSEHLGVVLGVRAEQATDRQVLFFSARRLVEALAAERPTAFGFEDVHWAEPSMLDLLEFLAHRVRDTPALFVATARPELFDTRPGWGGGLPAYTSLALNPLSADASDRMARGLLGDVGRDVVERLHEAAGGNPLFIEELASSLAEGTTDPSRVLPTSLKLIIAARLDALSDEERRVVLDASVVGKVFWRGALEQLGGSRGLDDALDALEAKEFVRRVPTSHIEGDVEFMFRHIFLPDVAYATIPHAARRERHAIVAGFAEDKLAGRTGDAAGTIARHWREAGESDKAVSYFVAAAEHAGRGWAKREAVALYGEALALLPDDDPRRASLRVQRAVAFQAAMHIDHGDVAPGSPHQG